MERDGAIEVGHGAQEIALPLGRMGTSEPVGGA
jgi:hypothetical protein